MLIRLLNKVKNYNIEPPRKVFVQSGPSRDSQDIKVLKTEVADQKKSISALLSHIRELSERVAMLESRIPPPQV